MAGRLTQATPMGADGIPSSLNWAYQASLNREADLLFWQQTHYKPNQRLNPADPRDRAMIPSWWAARSHIAQTRSARELIRDGAVAKALDMHANDPQPIFVHAIGPGGSETRAFASLGGDPRTDEYFRARQRDSGYVAVFDTRDARWPQPIYEAYPAATSGVSSPSISGAATRGRYGNEYVLPGRRR